MSSTPEESGLSTAPVVVRPSPEVSGAIRTTCQRLYAIERQFIDTFRVALVRLVPIILDTTPDEGRALAEGLARSVLWAALTQDPPEVIEATFQSIGGEYLRQGFPDDGYHGAGHALLRSARDVYTGDWSSELSSGWVAYYSWLGAHLQEGARLAREAGVEAPRPASSTPMSSPVASSPPTSSPPTSSRPPTGRLPVVTRDGAAAQPPRLSAAGASGSSSSSGSGAIAMGGHRSRPSAEAASPGNPPTEPDAAAPSDRSPSSSPSSSGGFVGLGAGSLSLDDVLELLQARYFSTNERALEAILTRVALRTGADLRAPRADQINDPIVVANVTDVLQVMGYSLQTVHVGGLDTLVSPERRPLASQRWWNRRKDADGRRWRRAVPGRFR